MRWPGWLIAALLLCSGSRAVLTQRAIPAAHALDLHVPVPPTPVKIDGRLHVAYELHITNFTAAEVTLSRLTLATDTDQRSSLADYQDAALGSSLARVGPRTEGSDPRTVGGGGRVVFFVWLPLEEGPAPTAIHHRLSYTVVQSVGATSPPNAVPAAPAAPTATIAGRTPVRRAPPVTLAPPLAGGPWIAIYDPSLSAGHRRALFAIDGAARIPARFAIDWIKLGPDNQQWRGDPAQFTNWYGYGAPVLAVADAVVAAAFDGMSENLPRSAITRDNAAGNLVTLDLGGSRYAFYEHLQPGSIIVKAGDRVRTGQVLGRLGGSGSVSGGPHLHFHVADAPSSLGAEGLPFVLSRFERLGAFESLAAVGAGPWMPPAGGPPPRRMALEMPAQQSVVRMSISAPPVRQGVRGQQRR